MAKASKTTQSDKLKDPEKFPVAGPGGADHQIETGNEHPLTTNQGVVVADEQNTQKSGGRGPFLREDFAFREKITHFDHERTVESVVCARGSVARGYFEVTNPIPQLTRASFLAEKGKKAEVFARCSTVAGGAGAGNAFGHLKVIGNTSATQPLFPKANVADDLDEGVIDLDARPGVEKYIEAAERQRVRAREARLADVDA